MIDLICKGWRVTKNKGFEIQLSLMEDWAWFNLHFEITRRKDHAGIDFTFEIPFVFFNMNFYDSRHWNFDNNAWEIYEEM